MPKENNPRYIGREFRLQLPDETREILRGLAKEQNTTMSRLVRHMIDSALSDKDTISWNVREKYCRRCRRKIISGADFDSHEEVCKILYAVG